MTVSLWPMTCLVRHSCGAKYDTDSDQVKYIILPGSLTLSLFHAHTHTALASHTWRHACDTRKTDLWFLFSAVATMYWLTYALHLEGLRNQCCFFLKSTVRARVPPVSMLHLFYGSL